MEEDEERAGARLSAIAAEAGAAGWIEPLPADREQWMLWRACDLASILEGCFHVRLMPQEIDEATEQQWVPRLKGTFVLPSRNGPEQQPYEPEQHCWLLDAGQRVGTIRLSTSRFRGRWLTVSSLYVWPDRRGRGVASRVLDGIAGLASGNALVGVRLSTSWTWQNSLRFYLARGFWVRLWKHDIELVLEPGLPERWFRIDEDVASLGVIDRGQSRVLYEARREGDRLILAEPSADDLDAELRFLASGTFSLLLALAGWPLVRSEEHWIRRYDGSDAGIIEGLAYKIGCFEQVAREHEWAVDTPRIPGLDRWQAWARGEEHGIMKQSQRDLDSVLRARGWRLDDARREQLCDVDPYFAHEQLLRRAVTAGSLDEWWQDAAQLLDRRK